MDYWYSWKKKNIEYTVTKEDEKKYILDKKQLGMYHRRKDSPVWEIWFWGYIDEVLVHDTWEVESNCITQIEKRMIVCTFN